MGKTSRHVSHQHHLSDFLYAELLHTLGAYKFASDKLDELQESLETWSQSSGRSGEGNALWESVDLARQCNKHLQERMHFPLHPQSGSDELRRYPPPVDEIPEEPDVGLLLRIADFYATTAAAFELHIKRSDDPGPAEVGDGHTLGERLTVIHDPHRQGKFSKDYVRQQQEGRLARTNHRLNRVIAMLPEDMQDQARTPGDAGAPQFREILHDHMGAPSPSGTPLHLTIVEAMSDAHMWMHIAEHLRAQTFGAMLTKIPETHAKIKEVLDRAIVLNTFVGVAGRTVPWVFAEDQEENELIHSDYKKACDTLTPTYSMWIGNHLQLLALQRRAYTWWTMGHRDRAYRDFHKLTRLLRMLRRQVARRAVRVPGTKTLIEGLTGIAEHHIGRIYRGQHAHRVALKYFDRASAHLVGWEDDPLIGGILKNSRWRLNLLISQGKACYELGRMKMSLFYYAQAWRAFLLLAESESHPSANVEVAEKLIEWLDEVKNDPELSKTELSRRLEPLVRQFETVYGPEHLRTIAADIMMRLGHLLFILKLPPSDWIEADDARELPPRPDHLLAERCLRQAASLDRTSTLIAADLLKIEYRTMVERDRPDRIAAESLPTPLEAQWPSGGGRFEEAARIIEYILQKWLNAAAGSAAERNDEDGFAARATIARELLGSFLTHTDSSNVKLAQVYRYLMHKPRPPAPDVSAETPTLDLVCLRRYSSFFPFLPRPAAFRALGGGYLVHIRDKRPFGIAVDPGPDFLDNLYRCGYALADIHMIVLTHDHADHMASVDALLALMGIRMALGDPTFAKDRGLAIVGNKSVCERYRFFNLDHPVWTKTESGERVQAPRKDAVQVMDFEEFQALQEQAAKCDEEAPPTAKVLLPPGSLHIEPVETVDHTDAFGNVSQGFLLKVNDSSILFTGDTGLPPSQPTEEMHYFSEGEKSVQEAAAEADVVVAHLSSVPLRELRALAGLEPDPENDDDVAAFIDIWERAYQQASAESGVEGPQETDFLLRQLQFGFRSRSANRDPAVELRVSPLSPIEEIKEQSEKHLYLTGLLALTEQMAESRSEGGPPPLLLIGELREELGTFRTQIASRVTQNVFARKWAELHPDEDPDEESRPGGVALTADIGLRVRLPQPGSDPAPVQSASEQERRRYTASVLCTTCDLDNDLIAVERFHSPATIREVCVKGENEGVFYNCLLHDPGKRPEQLWVESVERYDVFGDREGPW